MCFRFHWVRTKCFFVAPSYVILHGATDLSSSPDTKQNLCGTYSLTHPLTLADLRILRNATATPIKRTAVERQVNVQIVFLFFLLLALSLGSSIGSVIRLVGSSNLKCDRVVTWLTCVFSGSFPESNGTSTSRTRLQAGPKPSSKASDLHSPSLHTLDSHPRHSDICHSLQQPHPYLARRHHGSRQVSASSTH